MTGGSTLATSLRALLGLSGLTKRQVAVRAGLPERRVGEWVLGKHVPGAPELGKMLRVMIREVVERARPLCDADPRLLDDSMDGPWWRWRDQARPRGSATPGEAAPDSRSDAVSAKDAVVDLDATIARVLDRGFHGRAWVIEQVDRLVDTASTGYVWLEAPAGVGKSALIAHLVRTRGWPGHFARARRGRSVDVALRSLAAQLIIQHDLADLAPGGLLFPRTWSPEGFDGFLAQVVRRVGPVVLAVDGLDEALTDDTLDGVPRPWGLPEQLPDGVVVVATYRTGHPPSDVDPSRVVSIPAEAPENRHDVAGFLTAMARRDPVAAKLAAVGVPEAQFIEDLAAKCGGVWVYLRYILAEIETGERSPLDLATLPQNLGAYYQATLRAWRDEPDWGAVLLPLLATLVAVREPLTATALADLSGADEHRVRDHCHRKLNPFLAVSRQSGGAYAFALLHESFRDHLRGQNPPPVADGPWWADTFTQAIIDAHGSIGEYYLRAFGGLDRSLPTLADNPALATTLHGGYALRNLAHHLVRAARIHDLHHLLAADAVWFAAHDHGDSIDDYLADVRTARRDHQRRNDLDLASARSAPRLVDELRYWFIESAVISQGEQISPVLLAALVKYGIWTPSRALAGARRSPRRGARIEALLAIVPHLPKSLRSTAVEDAFTAAKEEPGEWDRSRYLSRVVPYLNNDQLREIKRIAHAMTGYHPSKDLLEAVTSGGTRLRPRSVETRDVTPELLRAWHQEFDDADDGHKPYEMLWAFESLAAHVDREEMSVLIERLAAVPSNSTRSYLLATAAEHLSPADRPAVIVRALTAGMSSADEPDRARALAGLLPYLDGRSRRTVRDEAHHAATGILESSARAKVLVEIASRLDPDERENVVSDAVQSALGLPGSELPGIFARLASMLTPGQRAQGVEAALATRSPRIYYPVIAALGDRMTDQQRDEVLDRAISDNQRWHDLTSLSGLTSSLLPVLSDRHRRRLADKLLHAAEDVPYENERSHLLPYEKQRALVLIAAAPLVHPDELPSLVTSALFSIDHADSDRSLLLVNLLPHLPPEHHENIIAKALEYAADGSYPQRRGMNLVLLLPHLPAERQQEVAAQAWAYLATHSMEPEASKTKAYAQLAPRSTTDQIAAALEETSLVEEPRTRASRVLALAQHLPRELLDQAIAATPGRYGQAARRAVMTRAFEVCGSAAGQVRVLRLALRGLTRVEHVDLIVHCAPRLRDLVGTGFGEAMTSAARDIYRWWG